MGRCRVSSRPSGDADGRGGDDGGSNGGSFGLNGDGDGGNGDGDGGNGDGDGGNGGRVGVNGDRDGRCGDRDGHTGDAVGANGDGDGVTGDGDGHNGDGVGMAKNRQKQQKSGFYPSDVMVMYKKRQFGGLDADSSRPKAVWGGRTGQSAFEIASVYRVPWKSGRGLPQSKTLAR